MSSEALSDERSPDLARDLRALVDSLEQNSEEREQYVQYAGLYVPNVGGQPWNQGSRVGETGKILPELTRAVRDSFHRLKGSGRADHLISPTMIPGRVIEKPLFYYWKIPTHAELNPAILAWTVASRESSSGFTPLILRQLATTAAALVRRHSSEFAEILSMFDLASCAYPANALGIVRRATGAKAAILWEFKLSSHLYSSFLADGVERWRGHAYRMQLGGTQISSYHRSAARRGVVGLVEPETEVVVYDALDRDLWQPRLQTSWVPHDEDFFKAQNWRSCVAWPILSDGLLVGALSIYSDRSARMLQFEPRLRIATSSAFQGLLRERSHDRDLARIEKQLNDEVDRIGISLMALGHVHDFADRIGSARSAADSVGLALAAGHIDEAKDELNRIKNNLSMLSQLTERLKRLSRDSSDRTGYSDAQEVVEGIQGFLETFVRREGKGRVDIEFDIVPAQDVESYACPIDALRLERVLVNLVSNATYWTASRSKRGAIQVRLRPGTIDNQAAVSTDIAIEVSDDGVGMAPDVRARVFERFFSRRKNGTGMGLYFAKRFVEEADGSISVESDPGAGTIFRMELPVLGRKEVRRG
jgi:signal transduction histidine kinase